MEFKELNIEWWVDQRRNQEKYLKNLELKENENTPQSSVTHWNQSDKGNAQHKVPILKTQKEHKYMV